MSNEIEKIKQEVNKEFSETTKIAMCSKVRHYE